MTLTPFPTPRVPMVLGTPEKPGPAGGGTDPAIFEIQRSLIELRAAVAHVTDVDNALRLREALNDLAVELGTLSDFAGARAERLISREGGPR